MLTGLAIGADLPVSLALIAEEAPEGMKGRLVGAAQPSDTARISAMRLRGPSISVPPKTG